MKLVIFFVLISLSFCGYTWLPEVSGYSESDANNGYAGILGHGIVGINIKCGLKYRIHYVGKTSWEPETTGKAGNLKDKIDGIAIKGGKSYKVYAGGRWLPAVKGYDVKDDNNGYAGILKNEISGLMIKGCKSYAVAYSDSVPSKNKYQTFVNYGTGVKDISCQNNIPNMAEGCFFMACCVIGGLGNDQQIGMAYSWALKKGYIRSDTFVNIDSIELAKLISNKFGSYFHEGWRVTGIGCNHYWAVDSNGREVFNAYKLYFKGNGC